ncbi:MAG: TetR/AcrR family transcriptional regulator [Nitrospirae bacterium]|nr:TetR/AcrR family transcriptional regulator [Nitrospirota bacterium]MBF0540170.1 TetR/AcrR family transcriptional regulator [Nitrospirota bacterium]
MKKTDTHQNILHAAMELISQKGYLKATTREIAALASVTELTLFRHFGSKENLFKEILDTHSLLPKLKKLIPELNGLPYIDGITAIGIRCIEIMKIRKPMIKIMLAEMNSYPESVIQLHHNFSDELVATLAEYFKSMSGSGQLREFNHKFAAGAFLAIVFRYFREEEIIRGHDLQPSEISDTIKGFVDIFAYGTINQIKM